MRFLLINQYGPGDPSPTARLLTDLSGLLVQQGWAVDWAVDRASYRNRLSGWRRWWAEGKLHIKLLIQGLTSPQPQVILSLTSPVCVLVTAALVAKLRGARHIHWAMDLYPDLALALGEVRESFLTRGLEFLMKQAYAACDQIVALDKDMQDYLWKHYQARSRCIQPWPDPLAFQGENSPPAEEEEWTWLYSGNLGRAHEWETLLTVQALLEEEKIPARLVFQGDGAEMRKAKEKGRDLGLKRCIFRDYAASNHFLSTLLGASVLIVTRKPETCGLLWPSKLALLQELSRPILWVGDTESHTAEELKKKDGTGVFAPGQTAEIRKWLVQAAGSRKNSLVNPGPDPGRMRQKGLDQWSALLKGKLNDAAGLDSGKSAVK